MKNIVEKMMNVVVLAVIVIGVVAAYGYYVRSTQLTKTVKKQEQVISELKESNEKLSSEVDRLHEDNRVDGNDTYYATVYDEDGNAHDIVVSKGIINYTVSEAKSK